MASNNKTIALITFTVLLTFCSIVQAQTNDCYAGFGSESIPELGRNGLETISQPLYMSNRPCKIGGVDITFSLDPTGAIEPIGVDTAGCRMSGWEYVGVTIEPDNGYMRVLAIADWPNAVRTPPMDTGSGVLFNILYKFSCDYMENVVVTVDFDTIMVADSTGYILFDDVFHTSSTISVGDDITPVERGDGNCDGRRIGSDVTYMVNYFRSLAACPCSRCAGDANGDGLIIGSDVTFLVRYLGGFGPAPIPCD